MKKVISGIGVLLTGALLFLSACIAGSFNIQVINSWNTNVGRFWTSIIEVKIMPMIVVSVLIMLAGIALMIWGNMSKSDN